MRGVKQRDTTLELKVRRGLHKRGLRYRLGDRTLPGSPDLVLPARNAVVFVHGCFWHAHDCRLGRRPESNAAFWEQKALANRERDCRKEAELRALGWRVFVVWQCQLLGAFQRENTLSQLAAALKGHCTA
jgi:DNA mismatch endonuclease (patch repair protein)